MDRTTKNWLLLGGLGIAAYLIYQAVAGIGSAASSAVQGATNAVGGGIASLYDWFTMSPPVAASGTIQFQNGQSVPIANIAGGISFDSTNNVGVFTYQGTQYAIPQGSGDANGNYPAVPYSSVLAQSGS